MQQIFFSFDITYVLGVLQSKNFDFTSNSISADFAPGNSIFTWKTVDKCKQEYKILHVQWATFMTFRICVSLFKFKISITY